MQEDQITIHQARDAVVEWLKVLQALHIVPHYVDAYHSALLKRLLEGKKALDVPPPVRFSYPCYDLGEGKTVAVLEFHESELSGLVIDQCKWERTSEPDVIKYPSTGQLFKLNGTVDFLLSEFKRVRDLKQRIDDKLGTLTLI